MEEKDRLKIIDRYEERLEQFGPEPEALGWLKGRQIYRFEFLRQIDGFQAGDSVLDVGCAFGDMEPYLRSCDWAGTYKGIDIVPGLIESGKEKYPHLDLVCCDLQRDQLDMKFDWVFCSGALTSSCEDDDSFAHMQNMLELFFSSCRKGIACNFLSPLVDYKSDVHFHPEIGEIVTAVAKLTRRFTVRHDYMPYEFTVYLYKDDSIFTEGNVFNSHEKLYQVLRNDK